MARALMCVGSSGGLGGQFILNTKLFKFSDLMHCDPSSSLPVTANSIYGG